MELPNIAAYAYQDVHVWSALLTCLRPFNPPWAPIVKRGTVTSAENILRPAAYANAMA
jgi:hypothetical protein